MLKSIQFILAFSMSCIVFQANLKLFIIVAIKLLLFVSFIRRSIPNKNLSASSFN